MRHVKITTERLAWHKARPHPNSCGAGPLRAAVIRAMYLLLHVALHHLLPRPGRVDTVSMRVSHAGVRQVRSLFQL